VGLKESVVLP